MYQGGSYNRKPRGGGDRQNNLEEEEDDELTISIVEPKAIRGVQLRGSAQMNGQGSKGGSPNGEGVTADNTNKQSMCLQDNAVPTFN